MFIHLTVEGTLEVVVILAPGGLFAICFGMFTLFKQLSADYDGRQQAEGQPLKNARGSRLETVRGFGSRILLKLSAGTAGALWGAQCIAVAVFSAQDSSSAFASLEAAAAAAGAFVVIAATGAIIYGWILYSGMVRLRNEVDRAFTNIDTLLKQQFDTLPKLTIVCTAYIEHESRLMLDLARSRNAWTVAHSSEEKWKVGADTQLAMKQLFAESECYPALRADERFARLRESLAGIEKQVAIWREQYNAAVGAFNARIKELPGAWVANFAELKRRPLLAAPAEEQIPAPSKFNRLPRS